MKRAGAAAFLIAVAAAWNGGNVGAIVGSLADEFSVSLGEVGLASGTFFFAGIVASGLAGSELARRLPIALGLRIACALGLAGNVLRSTSPKASPVRTRPQARTANEGLIAQPATRSDGR